MLQDLRCRMYHRTNVFWQEAHILFQLLVLQNGFTLGEVL